MRQPFILSYCLWFWYPAAISWDGTREKKEILFTGWILIHVISFFSSPSSSTNIGSSSSVIIKCTPKQQKPHFASALPSLVSFLSFYQKYYVYLSLLLSMSCGFLVNNYAQTTRNFHKAFVSGFSKTWGIAINYQYWMAIAIRFTFQCLVEMCYSHFYE